MKTSIIICTYNRSKSLARTLESLAVQSETDWEDIEVVVVDNNSTDDTKDVVESFDTQLPIEYVTEPRQGLAWARNRGVGEARGENLLFTDDDVRLDARWLAAYLEAFRDRPAAGFFGGRIRPDWQGTEKPGWLKDEGLALLSGVLGTFDFGRETRPYLVNDIGPVGASFALRRRLFDALGHFRTDLGVVGKSRGRGEDTEFIERARAKGEEGFYVGQALCWHWVRAEGLTPSALFHHGVAKGRSHRALTRDRRAGSLLRAGGFLARGLYQLAKGRGDRFRQCVINAGLEIGKKWPDKATLT